MKISKIDRDNKSIRIDIPLTSPTSKARVKERNVMYEYGVPLASRKQPFNEKCYLEWQIGYDTPIDDKTKINETTLKDYRFEGANGRTKTLYELSEYLYYFYNMGLIGRPEIEDLILEITSNMEIIDKNSDLSILRSHPVPFNFANLEFYKSISQYPLLFYKVDGFDIVVEITIKERQRAIGVQPMLYVCMPISYLKPQIGKELIGRCAVQNEVATLVLDGSHKNFILLSFRIFAILSSAHKHDVLSILKRILA